MANSSNCEDDLAIITSNLAVLECGVDDTLIEKLQKLECPFIWQPKDDLYANNSDMCKRIVSVTERKIKGHKDNEDSGRNELPWTKFVLNVLLCYEYAKGGDIERAFRKVEECIMVLKNSVPEPHMPAMGIGLNHVALACKIFLLLKKGENKQVENLLKEIPNFKDMVPQDQASIWALRGAVFLQYGEKGMGESIPFLKRALQLDPNCGELHFLLGKSLSRVRRIEAPCSKPCDLEIKSLELAAKMCNNAYFNVLLAYSYKDVASSLPFTSKYAENIEKTLMYQKAVDIYRKILQEGNCCRYTLTRIASGLLEIPKEWQDLETAEKCVKKALEMSTNDSFLNIVAGKLYFKKKDFLKAERYFLEAAKFGNLYAVEQLLHIGIVKTPFYNPVSDINKYLKDENFAGVQCQLKLLSLKGIYFYKVENDFRKALQCWMEVLTKDIQSNFLKNLKNPWMKNWPHSCNIHQIITEELKERMKTNISDKDELNMYKEVFKMYKQNFPDLVNIM